MPHIEYIGPDNKQWPSVTQLTRLLPQPWLWAWYHNAVKKNGYAGWEACKQISEEGMTLGTEVHEKLEHLLHTREYQVSDSIANEIAQTMYNKVRDIIKSITFIEPHLIHHMERYHGTADLICRLNDNRLIVLDWKTSYIKDMAHPIQLAAYAMAWNEMNSAALIDDGFIIRVDKKSKKLNVSIDEYTNLKNYFPIVKALRLIWEYTSNK